MFVHNVVHFTSNIQVEEEPHKYVKKVSNIHFRGDEPKKNVKKVSQHEFEHGDPDFVDERTSIDNPKKEESIFSSIFEWRWNYYYFLR